MSPARGEPNDVNLFYLGPPAPGVWQTLYPSLTPAEANQYAADSRQRFALLSMQVGLGLSLIHI